MTESYYGFRIIVLLLILLANGYFAAAEVSLLTSRSARLRQMANEGNRGALAALNLLANPERLLSVTQVGVTLSSLGLGWAGEDTIYHMILAMFTPVITPATSAFLHGASFALAFLVMSFAHVVIGEVVPKNLAIEKAERLAAAVAPPLLIFYRVSAPFVFVIERSSALVCRAIGLRGGQHGGGGHSAEELKMIVSHSRGAGHLPEEKEDMIHRVLDLDNVYAREIMVPRHEIVSIPVDAPLEQVLHTMIEQQHSRLPVYKDRPEQIVGVLFYKDLLPVWSEWRAALAAGRRPPEFRIWRVMRKHKVVPETKPLLQLLDEFRGGKSHMAMVVDEFGTIVGLVTVEDVLEQIVGEIEDEYDVTRVLPELEAPLLELDGTTKIRDLELQHGIEIPSNAGFETLAGFLLMKLGHIPRAGEVMDDGSRRFTVLEMDHNRIAKVRVEKIAEPATAVE
ncbi:MAG: hemolysin family protein [Bryobacteraceae bacterium]